MEILPEECGALSDILDEIKQIYNEEQDKLLTQMERTKEVVRAIRTIRKEKNIPDKTPLILNVEEKEETYNELFIDSILKKLCSLSEVTFTIGPSEEWERTICFAVGTTKFYILFDSKVDTKEELKRFRSQLEYANGFLDLIMKKLNDQRFMDNAPEKVIQTELTKKADTEKKIEILEEQIIKLS